MAKSPNIGADFSPRVFAVKFKKCPIAVSIKILGKKWTLLILRDIAILNINRFNQILRSLSGLTPRVLIMRLHELEECGFIQAATIRHKPRIVQWTLTEKGRDIIPILDSLTVFGAKWYAEDVFEDRRARTLNEIYAKQSSRLQPPRAH